MRGLSDSSSHDTRTHPERICPTFLSFARLVRALGRTRAESSIQPRARFAQFLHALPCPLPPRYGTHLFRLLFPHVMPRRRYQMKETVLARRLCDVMRLNELQAGSLYGWNEGVGGRGASGCLGEEVERVARHILEIRVSRRKYHSTSRWRSAGCSSRALARSRHCLLPRLIVSWTSWLVILPFRSWAKVRVRFWQAMSLQY